MAPANGAYEAALHLFSEEWNSGNLERFEAIKRSVTSLSFLLSLGVFLALSWVLIYTMPGDPYLWLILMLLPILALLNSRTKFGFLSLFVQIRISRYSSLKVVYAGIVILTLMAFSIFFQVNTLILILTLLVGQAALCSLLSREICWSKFVIPQFIRFTNLKRELLRG